MASTVVKLNFLDTTVTPNKSYDFPLLQSISDPIPAMKATIIPGNRASGSLVIPGGQKSIEIIVKGILFAAGGYADLTTLMGTMRTDITSNPATLTLSHWTGSTWATDWAYSVRRTEEIDFPESEDKRTQSQNYEVRFLVISY